MTLIEKDYKDQLAYLHQAGKFNNGHKAYVIVKDFIEKYQQFKEFITFNS